MTPLEALADPEFWKLYGSRLKDVGNRGVAMAAGGPVDLATMVMRPFGYNRPDDEVFGSSEYIGKRMEDAGMVSKERSPLLEMLASIAGPAAVVKGTPAAIRGGLEMLQAQGPRAGSMAAQRGMIRTPFGRIPETHAERFDAAEMIARQAEKAGYGVNRGSAVGGASTYLNITDGLDDPLKQVTLRFSNHGPAAKYVPDHPYFSVDPTNGGGLFPGGTQEQSYDFLAKNGFPIRPLQRFAVPTNAGERSLLEMASINQAMAAEEKARKLAQNQAAFDSFGFRVEKVETKAGKRYDAYRPDGTKVTVKASEIPQEIKTGDRRTLWDYIIRGNQ